MLVEYSEDIKQQMHFRGCAQCAWNQYILGEGTNEGTQTMWGHRGPWIPTLAVLVPTHRAEHTCSHAPLCECAHSSLRQGETLCLQSSATQFMSSKAPAVLTEKGRSPSACSCPEALWPWIRSLQAKAEGSKHSSIGKAHFHTADFPWALSRAHHEKSLCLRRSQRAAVPWCGSAALEAQDKLPDPAWNSCFSGMPFSTGGGVSQIKVWFLTRISPKQKYWSKGYEKYFCSTDWDSRQIQKVPRLEK